MSNNPRVKIGSNQPPDMPPVFDPIVLKHIAIGLNRCRMQRSALSDNEKDVKSTIKAKGVTPRALAIARRAASGKKESADEVLDSATRFISHQEFETERNALQEIREARSEIATEERELRRTAKEKGIRLDSLNIALRMQLTMDGQERKDYFDATDLYVTSLGLW